MAIKKVSVDRLRPGMYVSDLNAGWMAHPFLHNRFRIKDENRIQEIIRTGIREVYIDSTLGLDVDAPTAEEAHALADNSMREILSRPPSSQDPVPARTPLKDEIARARSIVTTAQRLLREMMDDARMGRPIAIAPLAEVVEAISASVLRNPSAMNVVCRLKRFDDYTFQHSLNVCILLASLGRTVELGIDQMKRVALGGIMHDIGKTRVSQAILRKPGRLTEEEFNHMKRHVNEGAAIVANLDVPEETRLVISEHHERYEGKGYPRGIEGRDISLWGRMAAIADVYDAISSDRYYHKALSPPEAMRKIFEWGKFHFDPELVQAFVRTLGIYPVGSLVRLRSGRLAVVREHHPDRLLKPLVRVVYDAVRATHIPPEELDLAGPHAGDDIAGFASPADYGIDIELHLNT